LLRWTGQRFENETPTNSDGSGEAAISFLFATRTNGLWAFVSNSVRHVVGRQWTDRTESWGNLIQANPFYVRAYEEHNGNVWFRHYGQGLFCASADGTF